MVEKAINHRWYRRVPRKAAKSENRINHSVRPKHTYEYFYREARIDPVPPAEKKSSLFGLGCIDIPRQQDQQPPKPRAQSRFDSFRASMAGIFEERPYDSSFRDFTKRDIPDIPSRSARRIFPYVKSKSYHEDYLGSSSSSRDDDPYHVDDIRYRRISEPTFMRRRSEAVSKDSFEHLYDDPYFYRQSPTSNTHGIMDPYEDYAYMHDDLVEEDMTTRLLLSPSITSLYQQDADSSIHRHESVDLPENVLQIESTPPYEDEALFEGVSCRIYDPLANHLVEPPVNETLKEIMIDAAGLVTEMMESIFPRDTMHPSIFPNQNFKQHQDVPFTSPYINEPRHTDLNDFVRRMALHTQLQTPSPPPPPRPQFVDPCHIPLRESSPERTFSPKPDLKAELSRYNKWWTDAQTKTLPQDEVLHNIPCLSPNSSTHDWTWNTHQLFCHAFDLQPLSIPQQDTSNL